MNLSDFLEKYDNSMQFSEKYFFGAVLLPVIKEENLKYLIPQKEFIDSEGRHRRIDFGLITKENKYALEVDGYNYHALEKVGPERHSDELQRQNDLVNAGYKVIRFSWQQIKNHTSKCAEQLKEYLKNDAYLNGLIEEESEPVFPLYCPECGKGVMSFKSCDKCGNDLNLEDFLDDEVIRALTEDDFLYFKLFSDERIAYELSDNLISMYYFSTPEYRKFKVGIIIKKARHNLIKLGANFSDYAEKLGVLIDELGLSRDDVSDINLKNINITQNFASRLFHVTKELINKYNNVLVEKALGNYNYEEIRAYLKRHLVDKSLFEAEEELSSFGITRQRAMLRPGFKERELLYKKIDLLKNFDVNTESLINYLNNIDAGEAEFNRVINSELEKQISNSSKKVIEESDDAKIFFKRFAKIDNPSVNEDLIGLINMIKASRELGLDKVAELGNNVIKNLLINSKNNPALKDFFMNYFFKNKKEYKQALGGGDVRIE